MKTPDYALASEVSINPDPGNPQSNFITFPAGTLVFVFWNEQFLPSERKKELDKARGTIESKTFGGWLSEPRKTYLDMVMCMIGKYWIPVQRENIKRVE